MIVLTVHVWACRVNLCYQRCVRHKLPGSGRCCAQALTVATHPDLVLFAMSLEKQSNTC